MAYIEVDIDTFSDREIQEEFHKRFPDALDLNTVGVDPDEMRFLLTSLYEKRRLGKDYTRELDELIFYGLGRIL